MTKAVYINLLVNDLNASRQFFETLGYGFNDTFSNEEVANLVISDTIKAMLHTEPSLKQYTKRPLANPKDTTEVLIALQQETKLEVDKLIEKALAAGGKEFRPTEDHGFMYARTFEDLDGHIWEAFWMSGE